MNNFITIAEMMERSAKLKKSGRHFTHLGIGPMSENLLRAVLELAQEKDFPVILIASRNQVDSDEFGGGYVCGFDQKRFVEKTEEIAEEIGFQGLCYFCRDHGGPWQRDEERNQKLPAEEAMEIAKRSYVQDIRSGFDLLHIDPTKDPFCGEVVPFSLVLERTVELIEYIEKERKNLGIEGIAYEVGTEETSGGLIRAEDYEGFIVKLKEMLTERGLPLPLFVVGQTGTLTRLTSNVGHYDTPTAARLSQIAEKYGMGLKEHNGDYLCNEILLEHPVIGLAAMNVAPEFGHKETEALFELADLEKKFIPQERRSGLQEIMTRLSVDSLRWKKWMMGKNREASAEEIRRDKEASALIAQMCGHYTLNEEEVRAAIATLYRNCGELGIDGRFYTIKKIKDSIDRYIYCFNLYGLTSALRGIE